MALTMRRWLAATFVLCAVALVVVLRDDAIVPGRNIYDPYRQREVLAGTHVGRVSERLRFVQIVDSVRASLPRATPASRVIMANAVPAGAVRVLNELVKSIARNRPAVPLVPVDLVFLVDTAPGVLGESRFGFGGSLRADYVLPRDSMGRCLVIGRVRVPAATSRGYYSNLLSNITQRRLLGPCGFFETFGVPSASVRRWLDDRDWGTALVSVSDTPYGPWAPTTPWYAEGFFDEWSLDYRSRVAMSRDGFLCAAGSAAACDSAMLQPARATTRALREATLWEANIVSPIWALDAADRDWVWNWNATVLGPRQSTVMAEMARTLGRERFHRFWTSTEPVTTAFARQAGQTMGEWTSAWAARMYSSPSRGPGVSPFALLIAVAVTAISLTYAIGRTARRQVA